MSHLVREIEVNVFVAVWTIPCKVCYENDNNGDKT